jgi:O-antigen/teichoic acid export membrane protein
MTLEQETGLNLRRRMVRGTASNAAGQVIGLVTIFLLTPYILDRVGVTGYGLWILIGSFVSYGALLDLGIGSAVIKFIAEFRARREADRMRVLLATVLRLYLGLGLAVLVLSVVLARFFADLIRVDPSQQGTASLLVLLMGLNLAVSIASAPAMSVLAGLQRFDLYNLVTTGGSLIWTLGTVVVLAAGFGVVGMVALTIPITMLGRVISVRLIRRIAPDVRFGYSGASRAMARTVVGFSSGVLAAHFSGILQKMTDEIVIGVFAAVSLVTPYALGRKLAEIAHVMTDQLLRVLLPVASELHAAEDRGRLVTLYLVSTRLTAAIFLSIGLVVVILAGQILGAWVGPGFEDAVPVITILTLAGFLVTTQWPAGAILQGMGRFRLVAISSLASGIVNLGLSIVLVQRMGIVGVALGTLLPTAAEAMGFVLPYTMWVLGVSPRRALREVWLPALLPGIPAAIVLYALRELAAPRSLLEVGVVAACGGLTYALVYISLEVTHTERAALIDAGRQALEVGRRLQARRLG